MRMCRPIINLLALILLPGVLQGEVLLELDSSMEVIPALGATGLIAVTAIDGECSSLDLVDLERALAAKLPIAGSPSFPAFSPDGTKLAFVSSQDGLQRIWIANWDGSGQFPVSPPRHAADSPQFSHDGRSVWYNLVLSQTIKELFQSRLSSSADAVIAIEQMTRLGGRNTTPHPSPDGRTVAFSTDRFFPGWDICMLDVETRKESCILGDKFSSYCRPSFSPDGAKLAFSYGGGDQIGIGLQGSSGKISRLTGLPYREYDVTWSPDGQYIAFVNDPAGEERYELRVMRLLDRAQAVIAKSKKSLRYPSWSFSQDYAVTEDLSPKDPSKVLLGGCGCKTADSLDGSCPIPTPTAATNSTSSPDQISTPWPLCTPAPEPPVTYAPNQSPAPNEITSVLPTPAPTFSATPAMVSFTSETPRTRLVKTGKRVFVAVYLPRRRAVGDLLIKVSYGGRPRIVSTKPRRKVLVRVPAGMRILVAYASHARPVVWSRQARISS